MNKSLIVGLAVISAVLLVSATYASAVTIYNEYSAKSPQSYFIFTDGTNIFAKNGDTGAIDSEDTDASTVIQFALDAMTDGGRLEIANGTYILTTGLVENDSYVEIVGAGQYATILRTSSNIVTFSIGDGSSTVQFTSIRNLAIEFNGVYDSARGGISINRCTSCEIENVYLTSGATSGAPYAIKLDATSGFSSYQRLQHIRSSGQFDTGLLIKANAASANNANTCIDCAFIGISAAGSRGVDIQQGDTNVFVGASVEDYETGYRVADTANRFISPRLEGITTGFSITAAATNLFIYAPSFSTVTTKYSSLQTTTQVSDSTGIIIGGSHLLKRSTGSQLALRTADDSAANDLVVDELFGNAVTGNPSLIARTGSTAGALTLQTYTTSALTPRLSINGNVAQAEIDVLSSHINMNQNHFTGIDSGAANATNTDIADGYWTLWKNTSTGTIQICYNDGGTVKCALLS